jgi:hypothetical protein
MLLGVTFEYVAGFVSPAGKGISKEEGDNRLSPSSTSSCSDVINFRLAQVILTSWMFVAGSV